MRTMIFAKTRGYFGKPTMLRRRHQRHRDHHQGGYNILEVVFASALLFTIVVSILPLFFHSIQKAVQAFSINEKQFIYKFKVSGIVFFHQEFISNLVARYGVISS